MADPVAGSPEAAARFAEDKHRRDNAGKFSSTGGGTGASPMAPAVRQGHVVYSGGQRLRAVGLQVDGHIGADTLLAERRHDLYVAMLHDQGHIPIKLLSPKQASALSIGADVILSSVGHGSAMDIAGRCIADARAMINTVARLAAVPVPT